MRTDGDGRERAERLERGSGERGAGAVDLGLYLIADQTAAGGRSLPEAVAAAIAGGVTVVQLRAKGAGGREFFELAQAVHAVTSAHGVPLIVNDRLDIMLAVGAEGVHLGATDLPVAVARRLAPECLIGATAKSVEQIREAWVAGADYVGVGPVFASPTKPEAGVILGPAGLRRLIADAPLPCVAIGGLTHANVGQLADAGVAGVCVVSAILAQPDIGLAAAVLRERLVAGQVISAWKPS